MIASIGASAASQLLSTLLSKLSSSSSVSSTSSSRSTSTAATSGFQQALPGDSASAMSPPPTQPLSGEMLMALMALQAQTSAASTTSASTSGANGASSDPVQKLFSAMDSDGDGEVSQTEMEAYIEKQGGTQAQADTLFNALDQGNASAPGISESQMQSAVTDAKQAFHAHHHRHGGDQADKVADTLLQAMDSNDDGAVSQDEFSNFVTSNGGSAADASSDFAALNTSGSNALTSADFAKAFNAYQAQQNSQSSGAMMVSLLNQLSGATASVSA